jgi:hypothetical protein
MARWFGTIMAGVSGTGKEVVFKSPSVDENRWKIGAEIRTSVCMDCGAEDTTDDPCICEACEKAFNPVRSAESNQENH